MKFLAALFLPVIFSGTLACIDNKAAPESLKSPDTKQARKLAGDTNILCGRFPAPEGFIADSFPKGSFGYYLNHLPLKPSSARALNYDGTISLQDYQTAGVIDVSVGDKDLQQCADAVMRLRSEYLYAAKRYSEISFNFVSGFKCDYVKYAEGYRYSNGAWVLKGKKDYSYPAFMKYMELVFNFANTFSLEKQLVKVTDTSDIQAGDVFIQGGFPGHCFIVVQTATNSAGKKRFMVAQSFMPAQSIQILQAAGSAWLDETTSQAIHLGSIINFPYLRRFK